MDGGEPLVIRMVLPGVPKAWQRSGERVIVPKAWQRSGERVI